MTRKLPLVLLADDDADTRALIARALQAAEVDIVEAHDGEQALRLAREAQPDLILLDVNMPRRDGVAVCAELRRHGDFQDVPIVMVTSMDDLDTIKHAYDAGATDFIVKPFNRTVLAQRVRHLLRAAKAFEALRESQAQLEQAQRIAQLGHWQWELGADEIACSDEAYRLFGVEPGFPLNSKLVEAAVHRDDLARLKEAVGAAIKAKRPYLVEHRIVHPGGQQRIIEHRGEPSFDSQGRAVRLFGTIRDITAQKQAEERIRYLAHYDALTGLPNRAMVREQLARALAKAAKSDVLVAIMSLDLDRFKRINDSLGHVVGDELLNEIGRRLRETLRSEADADALPQREADIIGRVGEDGFALLLHTSREQVHELAKIANRVLASIREPFRLGGQEVFPSASIGIAVFPYDGEDADTLMKNADAAMYHVKQAGRDAYQFYSKSMNASAAQKLSLEGDLKRAIERRELTVVYQPKLDLRSGRIAGAEALVRSPASELHAVSAGQIVALAEEAGMIHELGAFVLRTALTQARAWQALGHAPLKMSVNLSPLQFRKGDLVRIVSTTLKEAGLDASCLELEITESTVMHNEEQAIAVMNALSELGVGLAIDDFGVGYSSLGYLARFPIDCLKIDRSFIRNLPGDREQAVVTRGIISMARGLEVITVAEGVDSTAQMEFLRQHGCDQAQGYAVSAPLQAEEFAQRFLAPQAQAVLAR
jgi:diguanylate cyclase (GGDEF)-like protein/PAS domain S-box-containing protein